MDGKEGTGGVDCVLSVIFGGASLLALPDTLGRLRYRDMDLAIDFPDEDST